MANHTDVSDLADLRAYIVRLRGDVARLCRERDLAEADLATVREVVDVANVALDAACEWSAAFPLGCATTEPDRLAAMDVYAKTTHALVLIAACEALRIRSEDSAHDAQEVAIRTRA